MIFLIPNSKNGKNNQIAISTGSLPDNPYDLVKFALVAQEKLASVRAEIRAIKKLTLAKEVERQKQEEARMISEALLDAQTLIGDMTRKLPTAVGRRTDRARANDKPISPGVHKLPQTKKEVVADLGLTQKQVQQFETLSKNKDLVELAKVQARENDDIPTRTQVLTMAQARQRKFNQDMQRIDTDYQTVKQFHEAIYGVLGLPDDFDSVQAFIRGMGSDAALYMENIDSAIEKLYRLKAAIQPKRGGNRDAKR